MAATLIHRACYDLTESIFGGAGELAYYWPTDHYTNFLKKKLDYIDKLISTIQHTTSRFQAKHARAIEKEEDECYYRTLDEYDGFKWEEEGCKTLVGGDALAWIDEAFNLIIAREGGSDAQISL